MFSRILREIVGLRADVVAGNLQGAKIMSAISDLNDADVKLTAEVALIVPAIAQLQKTIDTLNAALAAAGTNDPAIAKAASDMNAASVALANALPAAPLTAGQ